MSNFISKLRHFTYGIPAGVAFYYKHTGVYLSPCETRPEHAVRSDYGSQQRSILSLIANAPRDKVILADEDGEYTAGEIISRARKLAHVFKYEHGVRPGQTISTMALTEKEVFETWLAAWSIRARLFPVDVIPVDDTIACSLLNARTKVLVVGKKDKDFAVGAEKLRKAGFFKKIVSVSKLSSPEIEYYEDLIQRSPMLRNEFMCLNPNPNDPAIILQTSGTDGTPRAVEYTHGMISESTNQAIDSFPIKEDDVIHFPDAFHHALGIFVAIGAMNYICRENYKGKLVLTDLPTRKHPHSIDRAVQSAKKHNVTIIPGPPVILERIIKRALEIGEPLPSVRLFYSGGAPTTLTLISKIQKLNELNDPKHKKALRAVYAGTEFGITSVSDEDISDANYACVGKVVNGVKARINTKGVLEVDFPGKPWGYFNRPDLDKTLFHEAYVVTGDLVRIDSDQNGGEKLTFNGREKEVLNINGEETSPGEVDRIISTSKELKDKLSTVCAFGVIHPEKKTHVLCALIVPNEGVEITGKEIDEILTKEKVKCRFRPVFYFFEKDIPERCKDSEGCINGSGKIARRLVTKYFEEDVIEKILTRSREFLATAALNETPESICELPQGSVIHVTTDEVTSAETLAAPAILPSAILKQGIREPSLSEVPLGK